MLYIFTGLARYPSRSRQCIQQVSRTFCYKPVERKYAAPRATDQMLSQKRRRKRAQIEEYDVNFRMSNIDPVDKGKSLKLIESISSDPTLITEQELFDIFEKLSANVISDDALLHENFNTLFEALKLNLPKFSVTQIVRIFTQICRAKIPMFDELSEMTANALIRRITFLTLDDIILVDITLRKYYEHEFKLSKLFETMRQAARAAFIVKVNDELVGNQTYQRLIKMWKYLSNNESLVKNVNTTSLSMQLLLIDDYEFQFNDVVCVIITLARFPKLDEHSKQLLKKMLRIWCNSSKGIDDVRKILELLLCRTRYGTDFSPFQDPFFVRNCSECAINHKNMRSAVGILNRFNEMNLYSTDLIDFVSMEFNSNNYQKLKLNDYAVLCIACEKANYTPSNWESKIVPVIKQADISGTSIYKQVDLAFALYKLGVYHETFIKYFMKAADIQILYKHDARLDELYKAYSVDEKDNTAETKNKPNLSTYLSWLTTDLEKFIGANKVINNVVLNEDLTVPLVMKVNTETGDFIDMKENSVKQNLICNENELIIGVLTQDIGSITDDFESISKNIITQRAEMKQRGWIGIVLDESLYGSMPTHQRAFTFFKIVVYAINNRKRQS